MTGNTTDPEWRRLAEDFAVELSTLRGELGLTWEGVAARSGVSKTYLLNLGRGSGAGLPSQPIVEKIAMALDVQPDHFRLTRARAIIVSPKVIDAVYAKLKLPKKAA